MPIASSPPHHSRRDADTVPPPPPPLPLRCHHPPPSRAMSYGGNASRHRGGGMPATTVLAAKVALASAALAAAASLARLAVPRLVAVAGAVLPRAWAVARLWLVPPYLFVTVHLIILVIWKLSDHRHFQQAAQQHKDPWPVDQPHHQTTPAAVHGHAAEVAAAPVVKAKEDFSSPAGYGEAEFSPDSGSGGGESCVTTESDEDASSSPSPSSYAAVDMRRSLAPAQERPVVLEREPSLPSQALDGDDDLDATWNAIMQKTRPAAPSPAQRQQSPPKQRPPRTPRARDPSVGAEEMNRRFDDFIKKNRNSFGRQ